MTAAIFVDDRKPVARPQVGNVVASAYAVTWQALVAFAFAFAMSGPPPSNSAVTDRQCSPFTIGVSAVGSCDYIAGK